MPPEAARGGTTDGGGRLGDRVQRPPRFVNQVTDEAGDGLTVDLAAVLVERANRIRAVIGCA
jgi:hypothetical protein